MYLISAAFFWEFKLADMESTFRRDELPQGVGSFTELLDIFVRGAGVDALFTDFPDLVVDYLQHAPATP